MNRNKRYANIHDITASITEANLKRVVGAIANPEVGTPTPVQGPVEPESSRYKRRILATPFKILTSEERLRWIRFKAGNFINRYLIRRSNNE